MYAIIIMIIVTTFHSQLYAQLLFTSINVYSIIRALGSTPSPYAALTLHKHPGDSLVGLDELAGLPFFALLSARGGELIRSGPVDAAGAGIGTGRSSARTELERITASSSLLPFFLFPFFGFASIEIQAACVYGKPVC